MRFFNGRFTLPSAIFIISLIVYTSTLYPGVATADNGEFQWVVAQLGLAHPPGFPLYIILGYIFVQFFSLFGIEPAIALNFFSAVTSALTLTIVYATARDLIKYQIYETTICNLCALLPTIILATSTTFWAQATVANIRSLTTLFAAVAIYALINLQSYMTLEGNQKNLHLFILATALGLTHHLSLAFSAVIMTITVALIMPKFFVTPRRWGWPILLILIGFIPWLYLPWRDSSLRTLSDFFIYALGLGFQGDFFYYHTAVQLFDRAGVMLNVLTFQFPAWFLITSAAGWLWLLTINWRRAFLLGGVFFIHTAVTATYRAPQTVEYMMPAYIPLTLCASIAFGVIAERATWVRAIHNRRHIIGSATLVVMVIVIINHTIPTARSMRWLSQHADTRTETVYWLENAPPDSVILADWHWYTPLKYQQEVEGIRPDLLIEFVFPRTDDYAQDWVNDIEKYLQSGRPVITTHYDETAFANLPPHQAHGDIFLYPTQATANPPNTWIKQKLILGQEMMTAAIHIPTKDHALDETVAVDLAWAADQPINISLKLFGPPWQAYAQDDQLLQPHADGLTLSRFHLTPRLGAPQGEYTVLLTASLPDGTPLLLDDGNTAATLGTVNFTATDWPAYTANPDRLSGWRSVWSDQPQIIGHDWDNSWEDAPRLYIHWQGNDGRYWSESIDTSETSIDVHGRLFTNPGNSYYVPFAQGIIWTGNQLPLDNQQTSASNIIRTRQQFHATRPLQRDIGIATRLIGYEDDRFTWAWLNPDPDNDIPALGAIPTLKWISGTTVEHPRRLTIAPEAYVDQEIGGFLRLYDVFTNRPLPILDERYTEQNRPWITFDRGLVKAKPE